MYLSWLYELSQLLPRDKSLWRVKINLAKARVLSTFYVQFAKAYFIVYCIFKYSCYKIMDYTQALARTTQMHIQIANKEFRITIIYDFVKVIKVETCI